MNYLRVYAIFAFEVVEKASVPRSTNNDESSATPPIIETIAAERSTVILKADGSTALVPHHMKGNDIPIKPQSTPPYSIARYRHRC